MRKALNKVENYKYGGEDPYIDNKDFKQGFLAGIKVISTMFMDI